MLYANIKTSFKIENYLLQFPTYFRRNFTKLRISAHNLAIETGRYSKPIETPIEKRLCFHCKEIENELHFVLKCPLYNAERNLLYHELSNILSVDLSPTNELFNLLMSGLQGDHDVGKTFCNYINMCFKRRSEILSQNKERDIPQRVVATTTRSGRLSKRPTILDL